MVRVKSSANKRHSDRESVQESIKKQKEDLEIMKNEKIEKAKILNELKAEYDLLKEN